MTMEDTAKGTTGEEDNSRDLMDLGIAGRHGSDACECPLFRISFQGSVLVNRPSFSIYDRSKADRRKKSNEPDAGHSLLLNREKK